MKTLADSFLGPHAVNIYLAGIFWILMAIVLVKVYYYPSGKPFSLKKWFNENLIDVVVGLLANLFILRLGDWGIQLFEKYTGTPVPDSTDMVAFIMVAALFVQNYLHNKRYKKAE